ncbi:hypothetical protein NQ315_014808, partial [Exocentrus adspersus]
GYINCRAPAPGITFKSPLGGYLSSRAPALGFLVQVEALASSVEPASDPLHEIAVTLDWHQLPIHRSVRFFIPFRGKPANQSGDSILGISKERESINIPQNLRSDDTISIREISDEISISKSVVHRTLKKNNFHPYHPEHHQFLTEQDCQRRMLFTDESSFANTGRNNRHNYHHYADQNPRLMRQDDHQHRFKVNVWAGICGEYVIGPHFLEGNLTGNVHISPDDLNSQWFAHWSVQSLHTPHWRITE